jgi:hypothetical protein
MHRFRPSLSQPRSGGGGVDPVDLRHQHLEEAPAVADSRRFRWSRGLGRGPFPMACSSQQGGAAPILIGGGARAAAAAWLSMAVGEAAR